MKKTYYTLDKESELIWDFKHDSRRHIIPETISISFKDLELNKKLAEYTYILKIHITTNRIAERFGFQNIGMNEGLIVYRL